MNVEKTETKFSCPVCQEELIFGTKECRSCGTQIFYRDLSNEYWNERKLKMLHNSDAIGH
ncbi:hypothetical protein BSQ39_06675 [Loigolactobacillus backii]|uniref:Zinc-ribbon domain-containing protein n=1 Tax=Loigolactobacillus backii TaxID=375175 RepID=A0A192H6G7_9LACO|nr:hypothetical protein AYR52_03260 [Loigolactobacillus backii]ANK63586.1 hypothetical protein AYR53_10055 [Loigolactobacillus backii]ANK65858.1 hypothetical protein AYR54_03260 [Loigolactobacillus backii]ANK68352.1 hypothetical protein AYR55_05775 [Loigolactobacillus backii]ANK70923.1 hypothetical protein AYR56_06950 [Loigolactobacillus backii]